MVQFSEVSSFKWWVKSTVIVEANFGKRTVGYRWGKSSNSMIKLFDLNIPSERAHWELSENHWKWTNQQKLWPLETWMNMCLFIITFLDSNIQVLVPSSSTLFHHRRPTSNLPVTFLTVQKSTASRSTMVRNMWTKYASPMSVDARMYTNSAATLKNTWKKAAIGCLGRELIKSLVHH